MNRIHPLDTVTGQSSTPHKKPRQKPTVQRFTYSCFGSWFLPFAVGLALLSVVSVVAINEYVLVSTYQFTSDLEIQLVADRVVDRVEDFFRSKVELLHFYERELATGSFDDDVNVEAFESRFLRAFELSDDVFGIYTAMSNRLVWRLHRQQKNTVSTQVRIYVNETTSYRYERVRSIGAPLWDYNTTSNEYWLFPKNYDPFSQSWFLGANESWPSGIWATGVYPVFGRDCRNVVYYSKKIPWGCLDHPNETALPHRIHDPKDPLCETMTKYSLHKVQIFTSSITDFLIDLSDKTQGVTTALLIDDEFNVIAGVPDLVDESTRDWNEQYRRTNVFDLNCTSLLKVWELRHSLENQQQHFHLHHLEELEKDTVSQWGSSGRVAPHVFRFPVVSSSEEEEEDDDENSDYNLIPFSILVSFDQDVLLSSLQTLHTIALAVSIILGGFLGFVLLWTFLSFVVSRVSEWKKDKELALALQVAQGVSNLEFDSSEVEMLLATDDFSSLSTLQQYLYTVAKRAKETFQFLPQAMKASLQQQRGIAWLRKDGASSSTPSSIRSEERQPRYHVLDPSNDDDGIGIGTVKDAFGREYSYDPAFLSTETESEDDNDLRLKLDQMSETDSESYPPSVINIMPSIMSTTPSDSKTSRSTASTSSSSSMSDDFIPPRLTSRVGSILVVSLMIENTSLARKREDGDATCHRLTEAMSLEDVTQHHEALTKIVCQAVTGTRGVVHPISHECIVCSWNAFSKCLDFTSATCKAAIRISRRFAKYVEDSSDTAISVLRKERRESGKATERDFDNSDEIVPMVHMTAHSQMFLCGSIGSSEMRGFVIYEAIPHAMFLHHIGLKNYSSIPILVESSIGSCLSPLLRQTYSCHCIDLVIDERGKSRLLYQLDPRSSSASMSSLRSFSSRSGSGTPSSWDPSIPGLQDHEPRRLLDEAWEELLVGNARVARLLVNEAKERRREEAESIVVVGDGEEEEGEDALNDRSSDLESGTDEVMKRLERLIGESLGGKVNSDVEISIDGASDDENEEEIVD